MATLTNITSLGTVVNERITKDAQLFQMPMPMADSTEAIALDLFGVNRTITIDGIFVNGTGGKSVSEFIDELNSLINGTQLTRTYHSDLTVNTWQTTSSYAVGDVAYDSSGSTGWRCLVAHTSGSGTFAQDRASNPTYWESSSITGNYIIMINTVEWKRDEGEVNQVNYTITMMECSSVTS